MFIFIIYSVILILADLLSKKLAVYFLAAGNEISVWPPFLRFIYVENTGAAFGILQNMRWFLVLVSCAVLLVIFWYIWTERCSSRWQFYGFVFIFSGTVGNFVNRWFLHYVIDFINLPCLPRFPTFNLADVFINVGVGLLMIYIFKQSGKET